MKKGAKSGRPGRSEPIVDRPSVPSVYGVPNSDRGLLDWSHVSKRMEEARVYWVSTVSPRGRPHATPVDGLWIEDALYFGGSPETKRHRNLVRNPAVCVHLESGSDVVILQGDAENLLHPEKQLAILLSKASRKKYGYGPPPEGFEGGGVFVFRPRKVLAWNQFPSDATRFTFPVAETAAGF